MRLSQYAKHMAVSYKTAFRWWKVGKLDAYQLDTGTIVVREAPTTTEGSAGIALYGRVSTQGQKADLDRQIGTIVIEHKDRLTRFGFTYIE
jgi:putative resolvase